MYKKRKNANVFVGVLIVVALAAMALLFSNDVVLNFTKTALFDFTSAEAHRASAIYWGLPGYGFILIIGALIGLAFVPDILKESTLLRWFFVLIMWILVSPFYWGLWFDLLKTMGFIWAQSY